MRVIPWEAMEHFLEKYSIFYLETRRPINYSGLEHLFLELNNKFGFDVEVENDNGQS